MRRYQKTDAYKKHRKTQKCKETILFHNNRRRAMKLNATIGKIDYKWINERDGFKCQICGKKVNLILKWPHPKSKSYDHIVPLRKQGEHSDKNLQLTHLICNIKKNANTGNGVQQFLL
jgi:5-methylcytosine-specific restriction endonuclease McrA